MSTNTPNTEKLIIEAFKDKGDQEGLGRLFKSYMPLVYGVSLKYLKDRNTAQDMVMQVYEKLFLKLKTQEVDNFKSWLYVLTKNECLMALRSSKSKYERAREDFDKAIVEFDQNNHHESGELESDLSKMETCIERLKNAQKVSIRLFYLDKKCYQEVAERTGEELKKVKSHIQNGKRNLKICIEELRGQER